jgi:hypothetical protein
MSPIQLGVGEWVSRIFHACSWSASRDRSWYILLNVTWAELKMRSKLLWCTTDRSCSWSMERLKALEAIQPLPNLTVLVLYWLPVWVFENIYCYCLDKRCSRTLRHLSPSYLLEFLSVAAFPQMGRRALPFGHYLRVWMGVGTFIEGMASVVVLRRIKACVTLNENFFSTASCCQCLWLPV